MGEEFVPIGNGDRVKDPITGFEGIVVVTSTWLNGCIRLGVQPEEMKDGKPIDDRYFDQTQLILIEKGVHKQQVFVLVEDPPLIEPEPERTSGGPSREGPGFSRG